MKPYTYDLVEKSSTVDDRIVQGARTSWSINLPDRWGSFSGFAARAQLRSDYADFGGWSFDITASITNVSLRRIEFVCDDPDGEVSVDGGRWDCEIYNGSVVFRVVEGAWTNNRETTR